MIAHRSVEIALLTERRFRGPQAPEGDTFLANILQEDRLLSDAFQAIGFRAVRVDWSDPGLDWSRFRAAVFRTTWDYFTRFAEFNAWLGRVESQTTLCNAPSIVRWNMDKHYLADLERQGVPIVPSRFLERGSTVSVAELLEESGQAQGIVKPCVSGGAHHTYRVHRENAEEIDSIVRPLLQDVSMMFQPFQEEIVRTGEDTLMVIDGRYTHAVRKVTKPGDFRVQAEFGGTVHELVPTREHIEVAERAMAACSPAPAYGRVDMVRDNEGRLAVMELEVIEPELWLRYHPPAAEVMARGIVRSL
jgi:glutathione synthase/RimK-type ligase-like ATP-grasp enzyme